MIDDPGTPEQILSDLKANLDTLDTWMSNARTLFHSTRTRDGTTVLDFATVGYAGTDLTGLEVSGVTSPQGLRLVADRNRNGVRDTS
ncbi:MAG: hypothetical protein R3324_06550, partial [Halobacteriales archaeon]|nr:hypothetical protein [Halobacteriales archaeon]